MRRRRSFLARLPRQRLLLVFTAASGREATLFLGVFFFLVVFHLEVRRKSQFASFVHDFFPDGGGYWFLSFPTSRSQGRNHRRPSRCIVGGVSIGSSRSRDVIGRSVDDTLGSGGSGRRCGCWVGGSSSIRAVLDVVLYRFSIVIQPRPHGLGRNATPRSIPRRAQSLFRFVPDYGHASSCSSTRTVRVLGGGG